MHFTTFSTTSLTSLTLTCAEDLPYPRLTRCLLAHTVCDTFGVAYFWPSGFVRRVLTMMSCYTDVRAVLVAGVGFFLDSYDIFAINLVTALLGVVFWGDPNPQNGFSGNNGYLPDTVNQAFKASTSAGIVIGMVVFGWLAEYATLSTQQLTLASLAEN